MEKIFITGGNGYLGNHLVWRLKKVYPKHKLSIYDLPDDILDYDNFKFKIREFEPTIIIHLAALLKGTDKQLFDVNVTGTINLLSLAVDNNYLKSMVVMGSAEEYGDAEFREDKLPKPKSAYGLSKFISTQLCRHFASKQNLPITIIRPSVVYSKDCNSRIIRDLFSSQKTIHTTKGEQFRDFIHVGDLIEAIIFLLKHPSKGEIYNIGSGKPVRLRNFIEKVNNILPKKKKIIQDIEYSKDEIMDYLMDISKIKTLGWIPKITLEKGIKTLIK